MREERNLDKVGAAMTYARDLYHIEFLEKLTFDEAISICERLVPEANLGFSMNAAQVRASGEEWRFLNKLSVCIELCSDGSIAIYHHDGEFHRVKAVRKNR
ncbi:MAG: hypothetical protein K2X27_22850 [Candidatus Obscuribacterales bacterium]|nr:hypothetical protein [Candidatus Obscuribacterales bacterium]